MYTIDIKIFLTIRQKVKPVNLVNNVRIEDEVINVKNSLDCMFFA